MKNKKLAERFQLCGFPTLFFFKYGKKHETMPMTTAKNVEDLYLAKMKINAEELSCGKLKEKTDAAKLSLVFFGDSSSKVYKDVFVSITDHGKVSVKYQFLSVNDKECLKQYGVSENAFAIFRNFDESPVVYAGSIEEVKILEWMFQNSIPSV